MNCLLHQLLYRFQFTSLKLIVNYCLKHWAVCVKPNQKSSENTFQATKFKKIQGLFKDLRRNLRTFQGKMEFKDFSTTSPKIQGLFKTVWTLCVRMNPLTWVIQLLFTQLILLYKGYCSLTLTLLYHTTQLLYKTICHIYFLLRTVF